MSGPVDGECTKQKHSCGPAGMVGVGRWNVQAGPWSCMHTAVGIQRQAHRECEHLSGPADSECPKWKHICRPTGMVGVGGLNIQAGPRSGMHTTVGMQWQAHRECEHSSGPADSECPKWKHGCGPTGMVGVGE